MLTTQAVMVEHKEEDSHGRLRPKAPKPNLGYGPGGMPSGMTI
jgi:hypothetical protein